MVRGLVIVIVAVVVMCGVAFVDREPPRTQTATFAAGCFWGVEYALARLDGVVSTTSGFTGGHVGRPTYRQVCSGDTGHAEAVRVTFDPKRISYAELLDAFWSCHDPSRQRDAGEPHRSIVFVHDDQQRRIAEASREEVDASGAFERPIATEILAAKDFYLAEEYHQQYLAKLGTESRCAAGERAIRTRLARLSAEQLDRSVRTHKDTTAGEP